MDQQTGGQHARAVIALLNEAQNAAHPQPAFDRAMTELLALYLAVRAGDGDGGAGWTSFTAEAAPLLSRLRHCLEIYLNGLATDAAAARDRRWAEACTRRSAVEILRQSFSPLLAEVPDVDDELADIDEDLRAAAPEVPPLGDGLIPAGLPGSHWWWRLPSGRPDMYRSRDYYEYLAATVAGELREVAGEARERDYKRPRGKAVDG